MSQSASMCGRIRATKYRNASAVLVTPRRATSKGLAPMLDQSTPTTTEDTTEIPSGYCHCGCGEKTRIAPRSAASLGWKRGEPIRFISGHSGCVRKPQPLPVIVHKGLGIALVLLPTEDGGYEFTVIDDYLAPIVSQFRWFRRRIKRTTYALTHIADDTGKRGTVHLHQVVMGTVRTGEIVDHKDGNGLHNRWANLRRTDSAGNARNSRPYQVASSKYKGVSLDISRGQWVARLRTNGETVLFARFRSEIDAARAYDAAAREYFGEFAYINFPDEQEAK